MQVKTAEETGIDPRKVLTYTAVTGGFLFAIVAPMLVSAEYAQLLRTLLLVLLLGLVVRTYLGTLLTFRRVEPSAPFPDDPPSVSVVVPAYNEEPVLADTIEAALSLEYPSDALEVVVCYEAASTDATREIAERYGERDERVRVVERDEPGGGKARAINYALRYATGDVIASIDADHQFEPGALRRAVRWFAADEDVWCVKGRCYGRNPTDSILALHATVERHIAEMADLFGREVVGSFTIFGGGQAFFRGELFDELGDFDEDVLVEDIDMSARIHAAGKKVRVDPDVVTYEENPPSLWGWWSQRSRWARGWMQVAVRHLPSLTPNQHLSWRVRADVVYTFSYAIIPALLVIAIPMFVLDSLVLVGGTYLPHESYLWTAIGVAPLLNSLGIFLRDWLRGYTHHPAEYVAAVTLWFYLFFQTAVYVTAFLDEFVFDSESVYVTTSRSSQPTDD